MKEENSKKSYHSCIDLTILTVCYFNFVLSSNLCDMRIVIATSIASSRRSNSNDTENCILSPEKINRFQKKIFFTSAQHYNVFRVLFEVSSQKVFQRLRGLILLGFPQFFAHHRPNIFQIQLRLDLAGHTDLPGFWC